MFNFCNTLHLKLKKWSEHVAFSLDLSYETPLSKVGARLHDTLLFVDFSLPPMRNRRSLGHGSIFAIPPIQNPTFAFRAMFVLQNSNETHAKKCGHYRAFSYFVISYCKYAQNRCRQVVVFCYVFEKHVFRYFLGLPRECRQYKHVVRWGHNQPIQACGEMGT